jgi:hypothetical protein
MDDKGENENIFKLFLSANKKTRVVSPGLFEEGRKT